jgi:hypothetical protein
LSGLDAGQSRDALRSLVGTIGPESRPRIIRAVLELARDVDDAELELHFALCLWLAAPGRVQGRRLLIRAARHDPALTRVVDRISQHAATVDDWAAVAAADRFGAWPALTRLSRGPDAWLSVAELERSEGVQYDRRGAWLLSHARVTRAGRSVAVGVRRDAIEGVPRYVPAFSTWDCAVATRWHERPAKRHRRGAALVATMSSFTGYWHWLMEGLLPIVRLSSAGLLTGENDVLVCLDDPVPPFIGESLRAAGVDDRVQFMTTRFDLDVETLTLPLRSPGAGGVVDETYPMKYVYEVAPNDIPLIRRRLGLDAAAESSRAGRRILVSRRDATRRRLANEGELAESLRPLGFETVVPGELEFRRQVELFAEAAVVVAPHGAGSGQPAVRRVGHGSVGDPAPGKSAAVLPPDRPGDRCAVRRVGRSAGRFLAARPRRRRRPRDRDR